MKLRYLVILVLIGSWGCNNQQPPENSTNDTSAEQSSNENTTDEKGADPADNPEIVPPKKTEVKVTHVIGGEEVYYLDGPQQMRPPDGKFKAGTRVELVQDAGSYSVVVSEDGIRAYVSTGSLKPVE